MVKIGRATTFVKTLESGGQVNIPARQLVLEERFASLSLCVSKEEGYWAVSETTTGCAVTQMHKTRKGAIAQLEVRLEQFELSEWEKLTQDASRRVFEVTQPFLKGNFNMGGPNERRSLQTTRIETV